MTKKGGGGGPSAGRAFRQMTECALVIRGHGGGEGYRYPPPEE